MIGIHDGYEAARNRVAEMVATGDAIRPMTLKVNDDLEDWWRRLIPDAAERTAFDRFISTRAARLSILLGRRYLQLPL